MEKRHNSMKMDWFHTTAFAFMFSGFLHTICCIRMKREQIDNFNVLLNLYKLNPLSQSNVFKAFSNTILLPARDQEPPAHIDDIESIDLNPKEVEIKLIGQTNAEVTTEMDLEKVKDIPLPFIDKPEEFNFNEIKFLMNTDKNIANMPNRKLETTKLLPVFKRGSEAESFMTNGKIVVSLNEEDAKMKSLLMSEYEDHRATDNKGNELDEVLVN